MVAVRAVRLFAADAVGGGGEVREGGVACGDVCGDVFDECLGGFEEGGSVGVGDLEDDLWLLGGVFWRGGGGLWGLRAWWML